eukprot:2109330-Lingulodinium_polyedra.AAC.1
MGKKLFHELLLQLCSLRVDALMLQLVDEMLAARVIDFSLHQQIKARMHGMADKITGIEELPASRLAEVKYRGRNIKVEVTGLSDQLEVCLMTTCKELAIKQQLMPELPGENFFFHGMAGTGANTKVVSEVVAGPCEFRRRALDLVGTGKTARQWKDC